jgi:hypothetical protein
LTFSDASASNIGKTRFIGAACVVRVREWQQLQHIGNQKRRQWTLTLEDKPEQLFPQETTEMANKQRSRSVSERESLWLFCSKEQ